MTDNAAWFFQFSFAATASTIDSGGVAERMKLHWYLLLSFYMTGWTYPVVAHWVWDANGWLLGLGFVDFAGSGVVHMLGGASALMLMTYLGPRLGMHGKAPPEGCGIDEKTVKLVHSAFSGEPVHQLFGTLLLWVAWYSFNGGSAGSVDNGSMVGLVMLNTTMAPVSACFVGLVMSMVREGGQIKIPYITNTILGGLVAITAFPHATTSQEAVIVGTISGFITIEADRLLYKYKFDDPVGVVSVHFVNGAWSLIAAGLFLGTVNCSDDFEVKGLFHSGSFYLLGVQCLGLIAIIAWTWFCTGLYLAFVKFVVKDDIRVDPLHEFMGLDIVEHGVDHLKKAEALHHANVELLEKKEEFSRRLTSMRESVVNNSDANTPNKEAGGFNEVTADAKAHLRVRSNKHPPPKKL